MATGNALCETRFHQHPLHSIRSPVQGAQCPGGYGLFREVNIKEVIEKWCIVNTLKRLRRAWYTLCLGCELLCLSRWDILWELHPISCKWWWNKFIVLILVEMTVWIMFTSKTSLHPSFLVLLQTNLNFDMCCSSAILCFKPLSLLS